MENILKEIIQRLKAMITSSSPSVSGNPRRPPSASSVFILLSVPRPAVGILFCGRSRMMYSRVEAPKRRWLSMGTCCGFLFSRRMVPMNVPCASNSSNSHSRNTLSYSATINSVSHTLLKEITIHSYRNN